MPKKVFETTTSVISFIKSREWTFEKWVGEHGYSTVPYVLRNGTPKVLPVSYSVAFADRRKPYDQQGCNTELNQVVNDLAVGQEIIVPDYSGCNLDGAWIFTKCSADSWSRKYLTNDR